eukprot:TRINITY_DN23439_c0_g2_i2.p1 TRINITY_DN23439_c0_g2~~TRINITY_DN23439_c0_g2_i2.p1  ORF type:complete len:563 (-),score=52.40 TRINITY_DN23439_c0_g2_i2:205-1893(-)
MLPYHGAMVSHLMRFRAILFICANILQGFTLRDELKVLKRQQAEVFHKALKPIYDALPKDERGKLAPLAARYAVHRVFVRLRAWRVFGLSPEPQHPTIDGTQSKVSSALERLLREKLKRGLDLEDVVAFAAAVEKLAHDQLILQLASSWEASGMPAAPSGVTDETGFRKVLDMQMMSYILSSEKWKDPEVRSRIHEIYPAWSNARDFTRRMAVKIGLGTKRNFTFGDARRAAVEMGVHIGPWQSEECMKLKNELVSLEGICPGRVDTKRYLNVTGIGGLSSAPCAVHDIDCLSRIGVVDFSDPQRPSVSIPNYIASRTTLVGHSSLYTLVCPSECEMLLTSLESSLGAPDATPRDVVRLVGHLRSSTEPNGLGQLPYWLLQRLNDTAVHGGRILLHGRLFSQWMHYAYPRECPFPQPLNSPVRNLVAKESSTQPSSVREGARELGFSDAPIGESENNETESVRCYFQWIPQEELLFPWSPRHKSFVDQLLLLGYAMQEAPAAVGFVFIVVAVVFAIWKIVAKRFASRSETSIDAVAVLAAAEASAEAASRSCMTSPMRERTE